MKRFVLKKNALEGTQTELILSWYWNTCALPLYFSFSKLYTRVQILWLQIEIDTLVAPNCLKSL